MYIIQDAPSSIKKITFCCPLMSEMIINYRYFIVEGTFHDFIVTSNDKVEIDYCPFCGKRILCRTITKDTFTPGSRN